MRTRPEVLVFTRLTLTEVGNVEEWRGSAFGLLKDTG